MNAGQAGSEGGSYSARSITILVPALNEEGNIRGTVARTIEALSLTIEDYEIIVINDGSSDGTLDVAKQIAAVDDRIKVIHHPTRKGLGYCYAEGYRLATKEFYVYIPGDNTWPTRSLIELFGNLGRADIVTSFASNPGVRPVGRRWISKLYTRLLNLIFGRRLHYFNGLTIYPVSFLRMKPATTFGFGFQAEVLLKAISLGLSYIEVPLAIDERMAGRSKAVTVRNIVSVLAALARTFIQIRVRRSWAPKARPAQARPDPYPTSQVVVVTGASSGIGRAVAIDLALSGHRVFACSRSRETLESALPSLPGLSAVACDVTSGSSIAHFVAIVLAEAGRVDVLVNCAGGFGAIGPIDLVDAEDWMATFATNLSSVFSCSKAFLPLLSTSSVPHIINFSGGGAFSPVANYSAYACAKAAVVRLTETLAIELARLGITVNAIAPGFVPTKAHEATIEAGPELAGQVHYQRAKSLVEDKTFSLADRRLGTVCECIKALISEDYRGLTGKTISANFDPWSTQEFKDQISQINRSDLFTMRRMSIVNLPEGVLRRDLLAAHVPDGDVPARP